MSLSVWYFIEHKNENGEWESVNLYTKSVDENGEVTYEPWDIETGNADYDLFDLIFDEFDGAHRRIPEDLSPEAAEFFNEEEDWGFDNKVAPRDSYKNAWYDGVELRLLAENKKYKKALHNLWWNIGTVLDANRIWFYEPGEIRILCSCV